MQNQQGQRGAIVMEASLALPFFMFAIYTLLSVIQISYTQARVAVALDSATVRSIWLRRTMGMTPAEMGSVTPALRAMFKKR